MDIETVRKEFEILNGSNDQPLIYFDNASTSLKPKSVINKITNYYSQYPANVHRSSYNIGNKATQEYENVRLSIKKLINAKSERSIIFTKGTTESINLIAYSWGRKNLNSEDEILLSEMEHHSNNVPWQICSQMTGAKIKYIPINHKGELDLSNIDQLITKNTRIVSIIHQSNVFGTINPIKEIINKAKLVGALTLIDAAQSIPHSRIDVNKLDCDFLVFSGHKMLGPTGVGILYGKENILNSMDPFISGGQMIDNVNLYDVSFTDLPLKFEAGTPNIAQVIGLGEAIKFLLDIGFDNIYDYENSLIDYTLKQLTSIDEMTIYGQSKNRGGVFSFNLDGINSFDLAEYLNYKNIAIRAGHHCAQPIMSKLKIPSTARLSTYLYNTKEEIDYFISCLKDSIKFFNR